MDENLSWKIVYIAAIFSLVVMAFAYFFIAPRESPFFTEEKMEKIAEFKNTRVVGRKEGKKVWELFAAEGWTAKDREITYLQNVSKGTIYQEGKPVVTELTAPRGKAFRHSEIVEIFGPPINAYLDLGKISKGDRSEWARMKAEYLKYIPNEKRSIIEKNVELHKKDSSIYSQKIVIDHDGKIADIYQNIRLERKDGILRSENMRYFSKAERLEATGRVELYLKEGNLETDLKTERASFYTDISKIMTFHGSLEARQGKKLAIAEGGAYSQKNKELFMKGKVKAVFEKARVIFQEKTVESLRNPEAKKILREKTVLTSDELVFSTRTGDARAFGSVFVSQKGREAKAEQAVYDDKKESLALTGKVYMKKGEEWVNARKVIVSVKDETFEAEGAVEAELKL
jgi:lipopolysaccharide export system protein LptA